MSEYRVTLMDGSAISVEYWGARDPDGRMCYCWRVYASADVLLARGTDLWTGAGGLGGTDAEMLRSLAGFLSACAESRDYRDRGHESADSNADLFPGVVGEWAQAHSDELTLIGMEVEA